MKKLYICIRFFSICQTFFLNFERLGVPVGMRKMTLSQRPLGYGIHDWNPILSFIFAFRQRSILTCCYSYGSFVLHHDQLNEKN